MKNILVCCPVYSPHAGGGGQYFPLLVSQLLSFDMTNKIVVLTEYHPNEKFYTFENNTHVYRLLPQRDTKVDKTKIYSIISFFVTYAMFYLLMPVLMMKYKVNIIHYTRYLRIPFYLLMATLKNIFKVKIILDMRTTVESDECITSLFGYSSMISNSMGVFNQMSLLQVPNNKNFFVPNPIKFPERFKANEAASIIHHLGIDDDMPYLLFVGQLLERKSIIEVIDAFNIFVKKYPDFHLVLVGRNMVGELIEEKINKNKNIIHIKPVPREKVVALMQLAEMIVQPSRVEGIPRVSLEALSLGKKVLLPPCVPEFVSKNEIFSIKHVTTSEIVNAMFRIYETNDVPKYDLSVHNPSESLKVLHDVYIKTLSSA